jgi:phosphomannomutase/phosphoglucomutase
LNPNIFRQYSIRGIADQDLTDEVATHLGGAIGAFFKGQDGQTLVVGRDVRNSSPRISRSLIAGLLQAGLDVTDVGVVPTPVHHFATDSYGADGGVMVTASHNPPQYNGLKIRADCTLHGEELQQIQRIANETHLQDSVSTPLSPGRLEQADPLPRYLHEVKAHAQFSSSLKIVVDGGNGTNGLIVSQLLSDLGCDVIELYCEPDGDFPNHAPDPTAPGASADLAESVRSEGADLGLAYDGDGDRLAVVDEQGQQVFGDQVIMLLARDALKRGPAVIVYEVLCTQALADDVFAHGGEPVMTPSGYAFVHQAMRDEGAAMGGEFSGHLFFNELGFGFDDSILASVKILNILSQSQRPLSRLVSELPAYHSSPQIRLTCPDEIKAQVVEEVKNHFKVSNPVSELDGARIDFGDGWALVRASNTQPVLSLRFEATSEQRLEQLKAQVLEQVEAWRTRLTQIIETDTALI